VSRNGRREPAGALLAAACAPADRLPLGSVLGDALPAAAARALLLFASLFCASSSIQKPNASMGIKGLAKLLSDEAPEVSTHINDTTSLASMVYRISDAVFLLL
jgi:hypothetical protein